ncbi:hypothetical protein [Saccharothrix coeruleofusca]|uniref:Uncharacterized protein n=1 Tax=Saccharothrix coeruleofusca TaxID=33919 RepID=A0A918EFQ8_9PSEU|nr:hypothetical protein [Saccharothrix coeruleofusca]MBP2337877.1 hypothetical protein [Saccharothrix coeruleofusca]GGP62874.1 hypothetical protein GCM10010185_39230 [Saccharothrix coeruleofusca]
MAPDPLADLARPHGGAPLTVEELVRALTELARQASHWSESVRELRDPTRRLIGSAAAASVVLAARRAEEAFLELEVSLGDARAARRPLPLTTPRGEDDPPMV